MLRNISAAAVVASPPQQQQPPRPVAAAAAALLLQGGLICNFRTQDLGWKWIHGLCQKNKALFFAQKECTRGSVFGFTTQNSATYTLVDHLVVN